MAEPSNAARDSVSVPGSPRAEPSAARDGCVNKLRATLFELEALAEARLHGQKFVARVVARGILSELAREFAALDERDYGLAIASLIDGLNRLANIG